MDQAAERLTEKILTLTPRQLAQVERFIAYLQDWECIKHDVHGAVALSEPAFQAVVKD